MARNESNVISSRLAYRGWPWAAALLLGGLLPASAAALTQPTLAALENPVAPRKNPPAWIAETGVAGCLHVVFKGDFLSGFAAEEHI